MAAARSRTPSLAKMAPDVGLHRGLAHEQRAAISLLVAPRAMWRRTSCSRSVSCSARAASARRGRPWARNALEHPGRHLGVEPRRAAGDGPGRGDEVLGRGVLEHEAGRAGVERAPQGVVVVERGQDQDRRLVGHGPQPAGGVDPVDPPHAHVHQHEVGGEPGRPRRPPRRRRRTPRRPRTRRRGRGCGPRPPGRPPGRRRSRPGSSWLGHGVPSTTRRRQAGVDPPPVGRGPRLEVAAQGAGPLPHADQPEVAVVRIGRRRRDGPGRPPRRRTSPASTATASSTRFSGAWRATLASASRAMRCSAVPTAPSRPATCPGDGRRRPAVRPAVLVDQAGEVGRTGERRGRCPARRCAGRPPWPGSGRGSTGRPPRRRAGPAPPRRCRGAGRGGRR